jgi:hypothetical protein
MKALTVSVPALLIAALLSASPVAADWLGVHIGSDGFGLSVGVGDWAPYGSAWHDPGWSLDFDVALGGYGEWTWVSGLGRVWRPHVAVGWRPYTHGRWIWSSAGWTWVAYEPWGYVPHHYGEWALCSSGWVWVPGYTYRPAHVVWVNSGAYVGWYPAAPRGWSHACRGFCRADGFGVTWGRTWGYNRGYSHGYGHGYSDGWHDARHATWVEWKHMTSDNVSRRAVAPPDGSRRSHGVRSLPAPPARSEVIRRTGKSVPEVRMTSRQVRLGERTVTMKRAEGVDGDIQRHARSTVTRALAPTVSRRLTTVEGSPQTRTAPPARSSVSRIDSAPAPGTSTATRPRSEPPRTVSRSRPERAAPSSRTTSSRWSTSTGSPGQPQKYSGPTRHRSITTGSRSRVDNPVSSATAARGRQPSRTREPEALRTRSSRATPPASRGTGSSAARATSPAARHGARTVVAPSPIQRQRDDQKINKRSATTGNGSARPRRSRR